LDIVLKHYNNGENAEQIRGFLADKVNAVPI
jgi:hypothetical protein